MEQYDVAIIGGGPAGYLAAERLGQAGKKTLLAEKRALGGVCLNEGCIPTKTLLYSAKAFNYASNGGHLGVRTNAAALDHASVIRRKDEVVKTLVGGVQASVKKCGATMLFAEASVRAENGGFTMLCEGQSYHARNVILAMGSSPALPNIPGLLEGVETGSVLTSREALCLDEPPKRFVVVGGGVVGLELAAYYNAAGSSVAVVEMMDFVGGPIDADAAHVLKTNMEQAGVAFYTGSKVTDVSNRTAVVQTADDTLSLPYDKLLVSVGRKPNTDFPWLKEMGVYMERGAVVTDDTCATNLPGLYAVGDINGKSLLAHTAYREAEVAVNRILGIADAMDYSAIPGVIYTMPEVASVGISEAQAKELGLAISIKKASINNSGRHIAECGMSSGFIKVVLDEKKGILLGATLVSAYASEIIYALTLIIQNKIPIQSIQKTIFPHPTVCEIIREVIFEAL